MMFKIFQGKKKIPSRQEFEQYKRKQRKEFYSKDFEAYYETIDTPPPDIRLADAAEYAAFQLGQINRKLDKLIAALQPKT
jgi:hypothetical protein